MSKKTEDKVHPMFEDISRLFHFRCKDCDKSIKYQTTEWLKASEIVCPYCNSNSIRHINTSTSAFGNIDGKVDYISYEKQSAINIAREGRQVIQDTIYSDPILKNKVNPVIPWWRDGSIPGTERKEKVLTMKEAAEVKETIKQMEANIG